MRRQVVTAVTLLGFAAALGDRVAAQDGGEQVAFTWCYVDYGYSEGDIVCRIVAVNPDAPSETNPDGSPANWVSLTEGAGPAWSPDGTRIAFTGTHRFAGAGVGEVSVLNLADGTLADPSDRATWSYWIPSPAWSPDGSKLAFASDRDGPVELYVMNADGSGVARLTHDIGFVGGPAWSPDGAKISFDCVVEPGNWDICAIDANGANVVRLTTDSSVDAGAAWSPADGRIVFATTRYRTTWSGYHWPPEIAVMNADGSGVTRLGVEGVGPIWSPDGRRIAFQASGGACDDFCNGTIYIMNADGSGIRLLTSGFKPSWTAPPLTHVLAPPIASFADLNYWGCDGRTCSLNAGESWDDASPWWDTAAIARYQWDFGDGTTGSGPIVNHTYPAFGTYTATLTVTDHDGLTGTQRRTFYVGW